MGIKIKSIKNLSQGNQHLQQNKRVLDWERRAVYQTRTDMAEYQKAVNLANALTPQNWKLQLLYKNIKRDASLISFRENRIGQIFSMDFNLQNADETPNEEQTKALKKSPLYRKLTREVLEADYHGVSLVQFNVKTTLKGENKLTVESLPRTNIVQQKGLWYPDYADPSVTIPYRDLPEYGVWVLEFKPEDGLGMLENAVPHVLIKRFAQSCYSEHCEIYATPPRVLTTNTQDKVMLDRATKMMKDMASAAWFIIDEDEKFEWAQGNVTDGQVYKTLIDLCRGELSLLINGAVIGQDTKNGSFSKEQALMEILWLLVQNDMNNVEQEWNDTILPALVMHGVVEDGLTFKFVPTEDKQQLMDWLKILLQYAEVDLDYITKKTGIPVTKWKPNASKPQGDQQLTYKGRKPFFENAPQD